MDESVCSDFDFTEIEPAKNLDDIWIVFDPTLVIDPLSPYYIPRADPQLHKLSFELKHTRHDIHAFLCGHRGSGKTTELNRLCLDSGITDLYYPVYLTIQSFGADTVHLTHDAIMVEFGRRLVSEGKKFGMDPGLEKELNEWGRTLVKTFLRGEAAKAEAGLKGNAWFAFFKAQLGTRKEWKWEQKQILEPKVQDLIGILNRMAQDLKNKTGKRLLMVLDDLEKGESDAFRETARAVREAAYIVLSRGGERIEAEDVEKVKIQVKKEYQPIIPGDAIRVLKAVMESEQGWVPGVEPFLQSRAAVEYENDELWIDLRYVLKPYLRELSVPTDG